MGGGLWKKLKYVGERVDEKICRVGSAENFFFHSHDMGHCEELMSIDVVFLYIAVS